jgi:hypothetical protein
VRGIRRGGESIEREGRHVAGMLQACVRAWVARLRGRRRGKRQEGCMQREARYSVPSSGDVVPQAAAQLAAVGVRAEHICPVQ